jgi:hypothetical protein
MTVLNSLHSYIYNPEYNVPCDANYHKVNQFINDPIHHLDVSKELVRALPVGLWIQILDFLGFKETVAKKVAAIAKEHFAELIQPQQHLFEGGMITLHPQGRPIPRGQLYTLAKRYNVTEGYQRSVIPCPRPINLRTLEFMFGG